MNSLAISNLMPGTPNVVALGSPRPAKSNQTEPKASSRRNRNVAGDEQHELSFESVLQQQLPSQQQTQRVTEPKPRSVTERKNSRDSGISEENATVSGSEPPNDPAPNSSGPAEQLQENSPQTTRSVIGENGKKSTELPRQLNGSPGPDNPLSTTISSSTEIETILTPLSGDTDVSQTVDLTAAVEATTLESNDATSFSNQTSTSEANIGKSELLATGDDEILTVESFGDPRQISNQDLALVDNSQTISGNPATSQYAVDRKVAQDAAYQRTGIQTAANDQQRAAAENLQKSTLNASAGSGQASDASVGPTEAIQANETSSSVSDSPRLRRVQTTDQRSAQTTWQATLLESITRGLNLSHRKNSTNEGISIGQELASNGNEFQSQQNLSINNIDAPTTNVSSTAVTMRSERPTPLLQQVFDAVKDGINAGDNSRSIVVRLRDPYVGDLQIHLQRQDDRTLVRVAAADDAIFAMLSSRSGELGEQLKASDLQLQEISHITNSNSDQSRFQQAASDHQERQHSAELQRQQRRTFPAQQTSPAQTHISNSVTTTKISFRA